MKNKNLSMFALTAVLAALSITLAGCAGPAKETASSAAQGQAASSAASQTEETGGETESLPPEENAGVLPQEEAGQAAPRTEAAPDTSASAKSSASSVSRAPERQPEASASRSSSTTAASRPATSPSRTQSPAATPSAPASTTRRPTTTSAAKTTRSTAAPTKAPTKPPAVSLAEYAEAVVRLVNQERAKAGLDSLSVNQAAAAAANVRAREIEGAFSHTRPNGSSFGTALKEQGASYRAAGENIAYGQRSAEQVMEGWMNSSGHRANILNAQYTAIGVGVYRSASGTLHWVQLFIG